METSLVLPIIDISSPDKISSSTAKLIRKACLEHGFFYVKNHGISEELMEEVLRESKSFFNLPLDEKMSLLRRDLLGYTPLHAEKLDPSLTSSTGDSKESFYFGSLEGALAQRYPNQWPPEDLLPSWRQAMECYYKNVLSVGRKLLGLIALALDLDEGFFEQIGALNDPTAVVRRGVNWAVQSKWVWTWVTNDMMSKLTSLVVRLLRYPGEVISWDVETYGASAHSDYGMVTLLLTDGVPGLQVCRDKSRQPRVWEDVPGIRGAFIVNIGDMMERWTNGLFRSTLHRVMPVGKERYSVVFFLDPNPDCHVECLESCCSETSPPRFPPILAGDYIKERFRLTYES
ncbi:2-oxoglutarate (2OG) and Fe(II)-dependent oxygenase superfamily protein [Raphanus sativus]|nr:2-oxoglutarate (2OG) and Fe(II)-dependent oxygenase superfamily protein [Raphanus sativus]KAJ4881111.1 2-oxoglutarate (2OG) and Fe(II)-dependent oxygenase superfamily protein [Raphanus sativus]